MAGYRSNGSISANLTDGLYWASNNSNVEARAITFHKNSYIYPNWNYARVFGLPVRCFKN